MLNLLPFLTKLSENLQSVNNRINKYLKKPNAKQIHDIRTSIRRLDATFSTLPKRYRNGSSLSKYVLQCKELFKINSEIRDFDIIIEKLQKYPSSGQRGNIIEDLKKTKLARLERAKTIAVPLKSIDTGTILDELGVTEKELQKRFIKIVSRLISTIDSIFPVVLSNPQALEELHDLRIACKKLRYMLELLPNNNKLAVQTRESLKKIQDSLGSIHDSDFTIGYLKSLPQSSKEIQEIIDKENEYRRLQSERFLNYSKRRLGISPDSFLFKLRSFNLAS
ncbi:MAG: CHAD domain-containing protein [Nitrososphaeraceae archaeon]|nr:CHAD domain-containing protein [Nitrososphaeraceae archaeon]MDW0134201.1 CHAD domain-containing protein [Nitrososphaeraceae archaeon]